VAVVEQSEVARAARPVTSPPAAQGPRRTPLPFELAIVVFLGWIYNWLQDLAPLRYRLALQHGAAILSFEQSAGIAPERAMNHWLAGHHLLAYISSDFYDNAIFGVTFCFAAWIWWRRPDIYRPLRNTMVLANLVGFAVFWAYPVAPPRMLPGFIDVVAKVGGLGSWHNALVQHADQLAAMPSMHLAWAVWCSLVAVRLCWHQDRGRAGGAGCAAAAVFAIGYPLTTTLVVLATGNHYLLDVLAGTGCTVLSALVAYGWPRLWAALRSSRSQELVG
jgi:hypothetical protein